MSSTQLVKHVVQGVSKRFTSRAPLNYSYGNLGHIRVLTCQYSAGILGPCALQYFLKQLGCRTQRYTKEFAKSTGLGGAVDFLKGRGPGERPPQIRGLGNLHPCEVQREKVQYCWILHLGLGNSGCMDRLGNKVLECSAVERDQ